MQLVKNKSRFYIAILCVVGGILNFIACYPGFLTPDSIDQFGQSLTGNYSDWHPPVMAAWWGILDKVYAGPQSMLLVQLILLWTSTFLLATSLEVKQWKWMMVVLVLAPFVQNFAGYVVKDSQMALSWLLAFSILFYSNVKQGRVNFLAASLAGILIFYGMSVRPNALPGCLPLCFYWVATVYPDRRKMAKYVAAFIVLLLMIVAQWLITERVIRPTKQYAVNKLMLHDLAGIYHKTGKDVFPPALYANPAFDTAFINQKYHPATFDMVWWNNEGEQISSVSNSATSSAIQQYWLRAIRQHPFVYITNRVAGFLYYLRLKNRTEGFDNYVFIITDNKYGLVLHQNILSKLLTKPIKFQARFPYMRPWFWFFLNIILIAFISKVADPKMRLACGVLIWSGLLYQLPSLFIFQTDTDFRYFYWNCISEFLAICMLVTDRIKNKRESPVR
jgi:hypothetical protein